LLADSTKDALLEIFTVYLDRCSRGQWSRYLAEAASKAGLPSVLMICAPLCNYDTNDQTQLLWCERQSGQEPDLIHWFNQVPLSI
jgi:hypothetical protein